MRKNLLTVVAATAAALALTSCAQEGAGPTTAAEDETTYASVSWAENPTTLDELTDLAEVVAVVTISGVAGTGNIEETSGAPLPYTDFSADVQEVLTGDVAGETITIRQHGDASQDVVFVDDPLMQVGDEYVLFLTEHSPGEYRINGGPTGRMIVTADGQIVALDSSSLEPGELVTELTELTTAVETAATE